MSYIVACNVQGHNYFLKQISDNEFEHVGLLDHATPFTEEKAKLIISFITSPWDMRIIEIKK